MINVDPETVRTIVTKAMLEEGTLTIPAEAVGENTIINAGEFRIDSLAFIRAFISIEDLLGVEFGDEALMHNQFSTFGDVYAYVLGELTAKGAA